MRFQSLFSWRRLFFSTFAVLLLGSYLSASELKDRELAIAVVAYNRPDYLEKVIEAIARNPQSETLPIYFFFDGGPNATQKENVQLVRKFNLPHAKAILRTENFGCPKNLIDARRHLFDRLGYEKVLVIEDDNVISENYFSFILNLYNWAKENIENVGAVCGWNQVQLTREEKQMYLNKVILNSMYNYWAYLIDKECWDSIKETYYEYEKLFVQKGGRSHYENAEKIRQWIRRKVVTSPNYGDPYAEWFMSPLYGTGQDSVMRLALWEKNINLACAYVNRQINVGKVGINFNEDFWEKELKGFVLDEFDEDVDLVHFELLNEHEGAR